MRGKNPLLVVGSDEADPPHGRISILAPGPHDDRHKNVGDSVTASSRTAKNFEILEVNFAWVE